MKLQVVAAKRFVKIDDDLLQTIKARGIFYKIVEGECFIGTKIKCIDSNKISEIDIDDLKIYIDRTKKDFLSINEDSDDIKIYIL